MVKRVKIYWWSTDKWTNTIHDTSMYGLVSEELVSNMSSNEIFSLAKSNPQNFSLINKIKSVVPSKKVVGKSKVMIMLKWGNLVTQFFTGDLTFFVGSYLNQMDGDELMSLFISNQDFFDVSYKIITKDGDIIKFKKV